MLKSIPSMSLWLVRRAVAQRVSFCPGFVSMAWLPLCLTKVQPPFSNAFTASRDALQLYLCLTRIVLDAKCPIRRLHI
jgi:hypothetical protein